MPGELLKAEVVEMICQRYHITPSAALKEDASILRHMAILDLARGARGAEEAAPGSVAVSLGLDEISMTLDGDDGV